MNERDLVDWVVIGASILSSFGILATIGVYFWQKRDLKKLENDKNKNAVEIYLNIFKAYTDELKTIIEQIIIFRKLLEDENCSSVDVIIGEKIYAFITLDSKNNIIGHATMYGFDIASLSLIYATSTSSNQTISENYCNLYNQGSKIKILVDNLVIKIKETNNKNAAEDFLSTISLDQHLFFLSDINDDFEQYSNKL